MTRLSYNYFSLSLSLSITLGKPAGICQNGARHVVERNASYRHPSLNRFLPTVD